MEKKFFHYEESMLKLKYVYQRRITPKGPIIRGSKYGEIVELIQDAQVMKNVVYLSTLYPQLVK